jgi:hypothetical protein
VLEYYAHGRSSSVDEAAEYHQQLDRRPPAKGNEQFDSEGVGQVSLDLWSSAFFVESVIWDTAGETDLLSKGLRGLSYVRSHAENSEAIDEIYPFVEVSCPPST